MDHAPLSLPATRREFLRDTSRGIGLLAFAQFAPWFLVNSARAAAPSPERDRRILVLVQLAGGNDGLNTVVPFSDDRYHRLRPSLGLSAKQVLRLNDDLGLHPACGEMHRLHEAGLLSIVQNVGYPNPNRSHFRSTEIWETASDSNDTLPTGWIGRYLDNACVGEGASSDDPPAVHVSGETPPSFMGGDDHAIFGVPDRGGSSGRNARRGRGVSPTDALAAFARPSEDETHHEDSNHSFLRATTMNALVTERRVERILSSDRPEARYPGNRFAQSLQRVAALIAANLSTRVYFVSLGGFDTHANQLAQHQTLLETLSGGLAAFQADLTARGLADQVLTTTFSEFGRRPAENQSGGTDHGTAAPLFVMGSKLDQRLVGRAPDLQLPSAKSDLTHSTDFRAVYATLLDRWLDTDADVVLGHRYDRLAFL